MLRHIVTDIRPEDVTAAAVENLNLRPLQLPAALLHSVMNVDELQPLLSRDAWKKLRYISAYGPMCGPVLAARRTSDLNAVWNAAAAWNGITMAV